MIIIIQVKGKLLTFIIIITYYFFILLYYLLMPQFCFVCAPPHTQTDNSYIIKSPLFNALISWSFLYSLKKYLNFKMNTC